jgi:hypothetical protein
MNEYQKQNIFLLKKSFDFYKVVLKVCYSASYIRNISEIFQLLKFIFFKVISIEIIIIFVDSSASHYRTKDVIKAS